MYITVQCKRKSGDCVIQCYGYELNEEICQCTCYTNDKGKEWVITKWFVNPGHQHKRYGFEILQKALSELTTRYGSPRKITYIWNGVNNYVLEWLQKRFDAECLCPLVILKTQAEDNWESHVYQLNKEKVLTYFELTDDTRNNGL